MKITVKNIPSPLRPEDGGRWRDEMKKARDQIGALYRSKVITEIKETTPHPPVDTGALKTGIAATPDPVKLKVSVAPSMVARPYAVVQELGRRPMQPGPPLAPIHFWVLRKGIASGKEAKSAAFLIARKLHRKGMKGRFFFRRARSDRDTLAKASALIRAAVRRFFGGAA